MEHEDHGSKQDQLEKHSLPGTNQAGKGPGSCEENDQDNRPDGSESESESETKDRATTSGKRRSGNVS